MRYNKQRRETGYRGWEKRNRHLRQERLIYTVKQYDYTVKWYDYNVKVILTTFSSKKKMFFINGSKNKSLEICNETNFT
jgi:hypothetical protein